jgi:hypothetical protein
MDDSALAAIAKWANMPAMFGWLALTARGAWRIERLHLDHLPVRFEFERAPGP